MGKTMGPLIPDSLPADKVLDDMSQDDFTTFILSDSQSIIDRDGTIRAVEGYGLAPGDMELQIYRPSCGNDSCPFPSNAILCPEPSVLCMKTKTCINPLASLSSSLNKGGHNVRRKELKDICRLTISGPQFAQYRLMKRVKLTITKEYFFIRLSRPRNLMAGDLLALRSRDGGGRIARRSFTPTSYDNETPDWKLLDGNPDEPLKVLHSGQMVPLDNIKYMIKIIMYEDLVLNPPHEYAAASAYPVTLKVSSPWAESTVSKVQQITVSEAVDKMRLRVSPPNAAVDALVSVSVILSSGTGVKLNWDFGDGTSEEALVDVTVRNEKFTRVRNYSEPGNYLIQVQASNVQSVQTSKHRLTVQHPITKKWKLGSNSPQLLPGQDRE